jgi:prepilin-type N-terminal cleavage/methylation domain-containing protein
MKSRSHKSKPARFRSRGAFSLIEVIATLVLSAILIALLLPLIGSALQGSRRALLRMPETYSLRTEMDELWQSYRTLYPTNLPALAAAITFANPPFHSLAWVDFDAAGVEFIPAAGTENVLRVTFGNSQGERLTTYFFPIL